MVDAAPRWKFGQLTARAIYSYRGGDTNQADNRALRQACASQVPLVYFVGTGPGLYQALYPSYITEDDEAAEKWSSR